MIPWAVACWAPLFMEFFSKNTGVGCHFLLQRIFPTQGSNLGLLHSRRSLCQLSYQVQWLGLHNFTAVAQGSVPGQGTKVPQAVEHSQKLIDVVQCHILHVRHNSFWVSFCIGIKFEHFCFALLIQKVLITYCISPCQYHILNYCDYVKRFITK